MRKQIIKNLHFELTSTNNKQIKGYINVCEKMNFLSRNL